MDQMRESAKLKRMLDGPDYCMQLFLATVLARQERARRWRRIPSARAYRLTAWPRRAPHRPRRIPRDPPRRS